MENNVARLKDITVLYCEDEEYLRDVTQGILSSFTKKQFIAENGKIGLDLFIENQNTIDLIITDVNMPVMNGLEMTKEIKAINPNIPIIVATAFSNSEYLLEAIELGVDKYVLKPINIKKLLETMNQSLLYHELRDLYTDQLTHTPNRNALIRDIKDIKTTTTIALIDIDKFSVLNDLYGEENGDELLIKFSEQIKLYFNNEKTQHYRVGSDKFVVLVTQEEFDIDDFKESCHQFINKLDETGVETTAGNIDINITISVAQSQDQHTFEYAQRAIQKARKTYKKLIKFDDSLFEKKQDYEKNINWIKKIKNGCKENTFEPYFQPIVDANTQEIHKYEALIRYIEKDGEVVAPFVFLPIAKKAKLYPVIIQIVLEKAIQLIKTKQVRISINLSFDDIIDKDTNCFIFDTLKNNPQEAGFVEFEILESEEIKDFGIVKNFIQDIKEFGCEVGIDDFGAGYANFNMLESLHIDFVKIDGSLIKEIDSHSKKALIVEAISNFCTKLGIKTVAEFVSSEEIYEATKNLGINYMQGYHFGKPLPKESI